MNNYCDNQDICKAVQQIQRQYDDVVKQNRSLQETNRHLLRQFFEILKAFYMISHKFLSDDTKKIIREFLIKCAKELQCN